MSHDNNPDVSYSSDSQPQRRTASYLQGARGETGDRGQEVDAPKGSNSKARIKITWKEDRSLHHGQAERGPNKAAASPLVQPSGSQDRVARPKLDVPRVERRQTQRVDASAAGPARARARDQQEQEKPWEPPTRKEFEEICKRMRTAEAAGDKRKRERDQAQSKAEAFFNQNKKLTGDLEDARAQIGRLTEDLQRASQAEEALQAVARAADTRARKAEAEVQAAEERAAASEQEVERVSTNYSNLRRLNASLETQMVTTGGG